MKKEEIKARLFGIIVGILPSWNKVEIHDTDNLRDDLGLESIDFLDIVLQTEINFNIKITPEEASQAKTVADMVALVKSKLQ